MKNVVFKTLKLAMLSLVMLLFVVACGPKNAGESEDNHYRDENAVEKNQAAYSCPMHPEEKGVEGDKCSVCGMALEPVAGNE
ncbi:MAG: hypothetical protein OEW75_05995 [Cyclobacteriaceae bacterium]|nr:hypothetical protein [Cyclobacteriaceae bacterium]